MDFPVGSALILLLVFVVALSVYFLPTAMDALSRRGSIACRSISKLHTTTGLRQ